MTYFTEPLQNLFTDSRRLILNFDDIPADTPPAESIASYFEAMTQKGLNPRLPEHRQQFNDQLLASTGKRYLVSQYGEDRRSMLAGSAIAEAGRTIHLGIDIFSKDLEPVLAPCDGTIVRVGREPESHSFGNYLILRPANKQLPLVFLGHLSADLPQPGLVTVGQTIARLGDYHDNENGGWSRHLHLQLLSELPPEIEVPLGYSSQQAFAENSQAYPDPVPYFLDWDLQ
ncbi:MAG: Peptidase [Candidatus Saccharibacteria bacterium]|nr:Peptidase [Candidatus Saccharibacteria bacterium]